MKTRVTKLRQRMRSVWGQSPGILPFGLEEDQQLRKTDQGFLEREVRQVWGPLRFEENGGLSMNTCCQRDWELRSTNLMIAVTGMLVQKKWGHVRGKVLMNKVLQDSGFKETSTLIPLCVQARSKSGRESPCPKQDTPVHQEEPGPSCGI